MIYLMFSRCAQILKKILYLMTSYSYKRDIKCNYFCTWLYLRVSSEVHLAVSAERIRGCVEAFERVLT